MEKHKNIPAAATWNAADNEWALGEKNAAGKETGIWNYWDVEGRLHSTINYGNGNPPFPVKRFHPDGTVALEGDWYGGRKWLGTIRYIKSNKPTNQAFSSGGPEKITNIWIAEFDYIEEGIYHAQRYFDKQKQEVSDEGEVLPKRPAAVAERAHYVNEESSENEMACWVMGQVDTGKGRYIGDYMEWDLNGAIITKRVYNRETGEVIEDHKYENGKPWSSEVNTSGEQLQSFYYQDTDQPIVSNSVLYRNNEKDRLQTFFDPAGRELYSIRMEEVSDIHERRYYNGVLVFDGSGNADHGNAPSRVTYFYPGGVTMIDYFSHGDGTGTWRLYDEGGLELLTLPVNDEKKINKYNRWSTFLPSWSDYEHETTRADWEVVVENFREKYTAGITRQKLEALVVPDLLKQELEKVDWESIESAMRSGKMLPLYMNGLLTEDEEVVTMSLDGIWHEIEHQGSIYEATYKVATILARMLPHYIALSAVRSRILTLLFDVLGSQYIGDYEELYKELIAALNAIAPLIIQLANDEEELTALRAQYVLIQAARNEPETEAFFIRERLRTANTRLRRAYATISLGSLYLITKQEKKLIAHYSVAFPAETEPLVRLAMAIHLVFAAKKQAQDPWLTELIKALTDPDSVDDDFYSLQPFISGYDVQEYMLMILGNAKQEVLERNMELVIEALPNAGSLKQVTLLQAIFSVLFSKKSALIKITPIKQKALLAAATVVDAHPNFVNHSEVFDDYNLPYDSYQLRQLAAKTDQKN